MITLTESERLRARVVGAPGGDRDERLRLTMHAIKVTLDEHLPKQVPENARVDDCVLASAEPWCACGRRIGQCDRSRRGCGRGAL